MLPRLLRAFVFTLLSCTLLACGGTNSTHAPTSKTPNTRQSPQASPDAPLAQVDRVEVPDQIATGDTLSVHLSGIVGPNGCYSLARIETVRNAGKVTLRPVVRPPTSDDQACTMALVPLDTTHRVPPPFEAGTLSVTVPQKDASAVTATLTVTEGSGP